MNKERFIGLTLSKETATSTWKPKLPGEKMIVEQIMIKQRLLNCVVEVETGDNSIPIAIFDHESPLVLNTHLVFGSTVTFKLVEDDSLPSNVTAYILGHTVSPNDQLSLTTMF